MMESAAAAAMPLAQVGHLKLAATASCNFNNFGNDNDVEFSINLETSSDLAVMESSVATAVPLGKVGHQKLAAKASYSLLNFMKPLKDCTDAELKHMIRLKGDISVKFAAENASSKVCMMTLATEKQKLVTAQKNDVGI